MLFQGINLGKFRQRKQFLDILVIFRLNFLQVYLERLIQINLDIFSYIQMQFEGINLDKFRQGKQFLGIFSNIQNEKYFLDIFRRDKFR